MTGSSASNMRGRKLLLATVGGAAMVKISYTQSLCTTLPPIAPTRPRGIGEVATLSRLVMTPQMGQFALRCRGGLPVSLSFSSRVAMQRSHLQASTLRREVECCQARGWIAREASSISR